MKFPAVCEEDRRQCGYTGDGPEGIFTAFIFSQEKRRPVTFRLRQADLAVWNAATAVASGAR